MTSATIKHPTFQKFVKLISMEVRLDIIKTIEDVQKIGNVINQVSMLEHLNKKYPDLSVAMLSHHIKVLSSIDVVTSTKNGRVSECSLTANNKKNIKLYRDLFKTYISTIYEL